LLVACGGESPPQSAAAPTDTPTPAPRTSQAPTGRGTGPATSATPATSQRQVPSTTRSRPQASPTPAPSSSTATSQCPNNSLQNCFSFNQMDQFLQAATGLVSQFFAAEYPSLPA